MPKVLLKNIGTLVSGDIENPILKADAIWIEEGLIKKVGFLKDMDEKSADTVIDCAGTTVTPGLFDSHVHPVLGDFTPRQKQIDFFESEVHGGVTTSISAGEVHLPGRPKDPAGTKALAILSAKSFAGFRPGGMKVLGGALILEKGLVEKDFRGVRQGRSSRRGRNRAGFCQVTGGCGAHGEMGQETRDGRHDAHRRHFHPGKLNRRPGPGGQV